MGRPAIDLTGATFGQLTVLARAPRPSWSAGKVAWWTCRCVCGRIIAVRSNALKQGQGSCGCLVRAAVARACRKHGMYKSREYDIWAHILQRCYNPNSPLFERYGAKGLTVAPRWRESFMHFYSDMGPAPKGHSIDRIDNALGYVPGNCRWANSFEQNRNRKLSHWIEWRGERLTVSEWARKLHVTRNTVKHRWLKTHSLNPLPATGGPKRKLPADPTT